MKTLGSLCSAAIVAVALALSACDGDDDGSHPPDGGVAMDSGTPPVCDPNAGPAHERLSNAAVAPGVDVVKKTPRHPGAPGPSGLP
jgi:hypothetical protein